jgi:hypothetical protein
MDAGHAGEAGTHLRQVRAWLGRLAARVRPPRNSRKVGATGNALR